MINYHENKRGRKITWMMVYLTETICFFWCVLLVSTATLLIGIFKKIPNVDMNTMINLGRGKSSVSMAVYFFIIPSSSIYYFLNITFTIIYAIVWKNLKNNRLIYIFVAISLFVPCYYHLQYFCFKKIKYKINKKKCKKDPDIKLEKPLYWDFLGFDV